MKPGWIYHPLAVAGYELCHPEQGDDFDRVTTLINGEPRAGTWAPLRVELVREDEGKRLIEADAPWLGAHALVFRPSAVKVLEPMLSTYGELLPLECSDADLVIFNPTRVLDALDETASQMTRFSSGKIMRITRYAFRLDVIDGIDIFKIPNLRGGPTFVSELFVNRWRSGGMAGLQFTPIWHPSGAER